MPNFIIIGAGKAGTTSLYEYLRQHPQVFMSRVKEPRFFALEGEPPFSGPAADREARRSVWTLQEYGGLFEDATGKQAIGEASPMYLYTEPTPERIHRRIPRAKLIVVLRDPVERAYSDYLMHRLGGFEPLGLMDAIREEPQRRAERWASGHYVRQGLYHQHLSRYLRWFDREQVYTCLFEDFTAEPSRICQEIFDFLGVDQRFVPDCRGTYQATGVPRYAWLGAVLHRPHILKSAFKPYVPRPVSRWYLGVKRWSLRKPDLDPQLREQLRGLFRDDTLRLQGLIDRDLSSWLR